MLIESDRLHEWNGCSSARAGAVPNQLSIGEEGAGSSHHVLDAEPLRALGRRSAARSISEAAHD